MRRRRLKELEEQYLTGRLPEQGGRVPIPCHRERVGLRACVCLRCRALVAESREKIVAMRDQVDAL